MSTVLDAAMMSARPLAFRLPAVVLFAAGYVGLVLFGQWLALNSGHMCDVRRCGGNSGAFNPAVNQADCKNAV